LNYKNFMLIYFINMTILISMISLSFVNIVMSSCPLVGFHTILMLIFTCYHIWPSTLLAITMGSGSQWRFWWCLCSCEYKWLICHDWNEVAASLCVELFHRFPNAEIMSTLNMVYPENWLCEENDIRKFLPHLD
jgi:hypothetical protein